MVKYQIAVIGWIASIITINTTHINNNTPKITDCSGRLFENFNEINIIAAIIIIISIILNTD